jgi:erythromycin esterase
VAEKVAWLSKNAAMIESINPRNLDYSDLRRLQEAIGSARMVLLGGSADAAVVNAKYRLVRFLHEEMGFDVLASNASLFESEELDRLYQRGSINHDFAMARVR